MKVSVKFSLMTPFHDYQWALLPAHERQNGPGEHAHLCAPTLAPTSRFTCSASSHSAANSQIVFAYKQVMTARSGGRSIIIIIIIMNSNSKSTRAGK